jgi:Ca2+-binding RTX toxin-like protein
VQTQLADGNDSYDNRTALVTAVNAGDGDDTLLGGTGYDFFYGGPGKDLLKGGFGNDVLDGGAGKDTVFGQAGNDELTSTDHLDALWGSSGKDVLTGGATMHGDDGNDVLHPALGGEHWGGTEYDVVDFSAWSHLVFVSLDDNQNDGDVSADPDADLPDPMNVHSDIEKIVGTAFNDVIVGSKSDDAIDGGPGNDVIDGRGGDDYLDVEGGYHQRVHGGTGTDDTCVGYNITTRDGCEH